MFQMKPIARQILLACGGVAGALLLAGPAQAQQQSQQQQQAQQQQLDRITVTGTNIRRTDTETVAPVEIITREQIQRSGLQSIGEVLSRLSANTGGTFNEYANSFAPGTQSISLRGLGQRATLVLINGRRVSNYGFAQNIQDSFVDLSQIPSDAIERVEVLKDGASAVYGSDAIAGVVNVIMRRDYKGISANANFGAFEGKNDYRAGLTMGFGDLGADKYNVLGVIEYYKRDELLMSDTDFGKTRDMRRFPGGRNYTSLTGGGTWRSLTNSTLFRANADCANPLTYQQAVERGFFNGNGPLPTTWNQPGNTFCSRDFANIFTINPELERAGGLLRGTMQLAPSLEVYAEAGFSRTESKFTFQEPFLNTTTGLYLLNGQLASFPYNAWFLPGVSGNPLASPAEYLGVFNDLGTRNQQNTADQTRLLAGAKWTLAGWDLDSALGWSQSEVKQTGRVPTKAGLSAALGIPSTPNFFPPQVGQFPFATNPTYNLNNWRSNSQAVRNSIMADSDRTATSELLFVDTKASTELGIRLPGGPVGLALGIEWRDESMKDRPNALASSGGILGQGTVSVDGSRTSLATFAEAALPLTKTLEGSLALRNDNYSDFGNALTPKVGLKWKPSASWLLRANWGRGFKAPTLPEISPSKAYFFTTITEPLTGLSSNITGAIEGNPKLKPEKSTSYTIGAVFEPTTDLSFGLNYYKIVWSDQVVFPDFQAIADNPNDPRKTLFPAGSPQAGQIASISAGYENAGRIATSGIDFDTRLLQRTTFGRFTGRLSTTYVDTYSVGGTEIAGNQLAGLLINAIGMPRWRGNLGVDWDQGPWALTANVFYIGSHRKDFGSGTLYAPPPATLQIQNGSMPRKVESYYTVDLTGSYAITPRLRVGAAILNVMDQHPPFDPGVSTTYFFDRTLYNVVGRTFRVGLRYTFE